MKMPNTGKERKCKERRNLKRSIGRRIEKYNVIKKKDRSLNNMGIDSGI